MPIHDWRAVADLMWQGMTIQQASQELGFDYRTVRWHLNTEQGAPIKQLLLDTAMLASARQEILDGYTRNE